MPIPMLALREIDSLEEGWLMIRLRTSNGIGIGVWLAVIGDMVLQYR
jgi:hypothetical protein